MREIHITEQELHQLVEFMREHYGIDLAKKKKLIVGRLQNYLLRSKFGSFSEFYDYMIHDKSGEAVSLLLNKLTTNHTYFMREKEHFEFFRETIVPHILKTEKSRDMRIWSAGCSSGEEPYTIAMILDDCFSSGRGNWDMKILATDISERVLSIAAEGKYLSENLEVLPEAWRNKYFERSSDQYSKVIDRLRSEIIYRKFNLMEPLFPFKKKFHMIWCRNVMIYFDAPTRYNLIEKFYDCIEPGGYLFIGHSESVTKTETRFKYVLPAIYRKE